MLWVCTCVFSVRLKYDAFIHLCLRLLINIRFFSLDQHVFPLPSDRFHSSFLGWCIVRCSVNHTDGHISVWMSGTVHSESFSSHYLCICEAFVWDVCKYHNLFSLQDISALTFMHLTDAFIQSHLQWIQGIPYYHVFLRNQTHDLDVTSAIWATRTIAKTDE